MADNLTNLEFQFNTGFHFNFPRIRREFLWDNWYEGRLGSILPQETIDNGLKLFKREDLIEFNPFRRMSIQHASAVLAQPPLYDSDDEATKEWLKENAGKLYDYLRLATKYWSIKDRAILIVRQTGRLEAIDPSHYFRVGRLEDADDLVGHVIAQRYNDTPEHYRNPQANLPPNKILIYKFSEVEGINQSRVYNYIGTWTDGYIGEPAGPLVTNPIRIVCTMGRGDGWYDAAKVPAARMMIRLTNADAELNQYINTLRLLPSEVLTIVNRLDADGNPTVATPTEAVEELREKVRPAIVTSRNGSGGGGEIGYSPLEPMVSESIELYKTYDKLFHEAAQTTYDPDRGNPSGVAIDRRTDPFQARGEDFRRSMALCIPRLFLALGAPTDRIAVAWQTGIYQSEAERKAEIRLDIQQSGLPQGIGLKALGYDIPDEMIEMLNNMQSQNNQNQNTGDNNVNN